MFVRIVFICLLFCVALFAEQETDVLEDSTESKSSPSPHSIPNLDLLQKLPLHPVPFPEMRIPFERNTGILLAPDAKSVEPNGLIFEVDPTVDLKMIYPKETREKILEEKFKKKEMPRIYRFK